MSKFNPDKLSFEYRGGITATQPVLQRRYTLTHSDDTGRLFLTVGDDFAWDKVNTMMRDEVLSEWFINGEYLYFCVYVYIDQGEHNQNVAKKRSEIFIRELPLALTAIRYGDSLLFERYSNLDNALIVVNFISTYPQLSRQETWGTFNNFIM